MIGKLFIIEFVVLYICYKVKIWNFCIKKFIIEFWKKCIWMWFDIDFEIGLVVRVLVVLKIFGGVWMFKNNFLERVLV